MICFDQLQSSDSELASSCQKCGISMCSKCFLRMSRITCPHCRADTNNSILWSASGKPEEFAHEDEYIPFARDLLKWRGTELNKLSKHTACVNEYIWFMKLIVRLGLQDSPNSTLASVTCIDKMWHAHILNTKSYFEFCNLLGVDYVHHCFMEDSRENRTVRLETTIGYVQERKLTDYSKSIWCVDICDGDSPSPNIRCTMF